MNFLGVLGWVIATFLIGFLLGVGVGGTASKKKNSEDNQKMTEK